eukprot:scaffold10150_cov28-Tisochrysis_lutea.AAC.4
MSRATRGLPLPALALRARRRAPAPLCRKRRQGQRHALCWRAAEGRRHPRARLTPRPARRVSPRTYHPRRLPPRRSVSPCPACSTAMRLMELEDGGGGGRLRDVPIEQWRIHTPTAHPRAASPHARAHTALPRGRTRREASPPSSTPLKNSTHPERAPQIIGSFSSPHQT